MYFGSVVHVGLTVGFKIKTCFGIVYFRIFVNFAY